MGLKRRIVIMCSAIPGNMVVRGTGSGTVPAYSIFGSERDKQDMDTKTL